MTILKVLAIGASFAVAQSALAAPLLTNGGFETGDFTAWTVTDAVGGVAGGDGTWFVQSGTTAPLSGSATAGSAGGAYYAMTDQTGAGAHALAQSFTVPLGATSVILSFDMFVNDQSGVGPIIDPIGLDSTVPANQHARVDLLTAGASAFDTGAGVINNFFLGIDAGANPHAYTPYLFDITALVTPGSIYQIRFAEVDNQFFFNQGVDEVSIDAQVSAVPAPAGIWLIGSGLVSLLGMRRKVSETTGL